MTVIFERTCLLLYKAVKRTVDEFRTRETPNINRKVSETLITVIKIGIGKGMDLNKSE